MLPGNSSIAVSSLLSIVAMHDTILNIWCYVGRNVLLLSGLLDDDSAGKWKLKALFTVDD